MKPEVGDLVAWAANGRGIHLGAVYGHDRNGNPMIIRHSDGGKQMVLRVCTLVIRRKAEGISMYQDTRIIDALEWWYDLSL